MRVAVTGANGFIGRHVASRLSSRGDAVAPVARPFATATLVDLFTSVDVVVHLAGVVSARDEHEYVDGNVTSTETVARAAQRAQVPVVHISSLAAAGAASAAAPRLETDPPAPITTYGRTKLAGELALKGTSGLKWTVLRPGVVYGPGDRALVPLFRLARSGILPLVGRATAAYTFVYIDDIVDAILAAVDRPARGATVFVGHDRPVTARELVEEIRRAAASPARIVRVPRAALRVAAWAGDVFTAATGRAAMINSRRFVELDAPGFVCRVGRLREELGVEAKVGLGDGLRRSASWYLSQV